jgi:hypothetical protein
MTKQTVALRNFCELANNGHRHRSRPKNCIQLGTYIPLDALDIPNASYSADDFHFREQKKSRLAQGRKNKAGEISTAARESFTVRRKKKKQGHCPELGTGPVSL